MVTVFPGLEKIFCDKPAWLDQVSGAKRRLRAFNVTATTNHENSLIRHHFVGYFRINQHGWTRIFNVTATTTDENSLMRYHFVGDFRIKGCSIMSTVISEDNRNLQGQV